MSKMVTINQGTEEWDAWFEYYPAGSKMRARMLSCVAEETPFLAWSRLPPEAPNADRLAYPQKELGTQKPTRPIAHAEDIDAIADRVAQSQQRQGEEAATDRSRRRKQSRSAAQLADALDAVQAGKAPQIIGSGDFGIVSVVDPFEEGVVADRKRNDPYFDQPGRTPYSGEKLKVVRLDPIGRMHSRKQLRRDNEDDNANADLRLKAARRWQALYEAAEIGGARGIDPTKDTVDGGTLTLPDTDRRLMAQEELGNIDAKLGEEGTGIVRRVLGEKHGAAAVAAMLGETSERAIAYVRRRVVECLDTMARHWGYTMKPACGPRRGRDQFDELAIAATSPRLYDAMQRAKTES
jgi:hypothetical protein